MREGGTKWEKVVNPFYRQAHGRAYLIGVSRMGAAFRGRFEVRIDLKGRLCLPSSYRSQKTAKQFVVTNGQYRSERCLDVFTLSQWEALERRIQKLPGLNAQVQAFQRFYLSGGQVVDLDGQNRILIPPSLRKYADLVGGSEGFTDVVLIGMGHKFEIWSQGKWDRMAENLAQDMDATLAAIASLMKDR